MVKRIRAILFDLGDTLIDFGKIDVPTLFEAGAKLAYEYLHELGQPMPSFARYHRRQLWAIRWNYVKSRLTRREFNALDLIGRLGARMGHRLTPEQTLQLACLWYQPLSEVATVEPGTREMLTEFRDAGLALGIISNTFVPGQVLDRHLEREGLLDLLPVRVYSCDVRYRKPSPRIFALALERAGASPGETLFVGDSPQADVRGANRAGMVSVLKDAPGGHHSSSARPRHRIARLTELREVVTEYNGKP